jgi:hypothetical protein
MEIIGAALRSDGEIASVIPVRVLVRKAYDICFCIVSFNGMEWIGLIWLRIGTSGGLL